jgi:hypothetical protein
MSVDFLIDSVDSPTAGVLHIVTPENPRAPLEDGGDGRRSAWQEFDAYWHFCLSTKFLNRVTVVLNIPTEPTALQPVWRAWAGK